MPPLPPAQSSPIWSLVCMFSNMHHAVTKHTLVIWLPSFIVTWPSSSIHVLVQRQMIDLHVKWVWKGWENFSRTDTLTRISSSIYVALICGYKHWFHLYIVVPNNILCPKHLTPKFPPMKFLLAVQYVQLHSTTAPENPLTSMIPHNNPASQHHRISTVTQFHSKFKSGVQN